MTSLQEAVRKLRLLCKDNGIYTLSSLECFVHAGDGVTQGEIATNSNQSASAVGVWVNLAEVHGLLSLERLPSGRRKPISYTVAGEELIEEFQKILCHSK